VHHKCKTHEANTDDPWPVFGIHQVAFRKGSWNLI